MIDSLQGNFNSTGRNTSLNMAYNSISHSQQYNLNCLQVEPQKGLGIFRMESNINYVISELKCRGETFDSVDLIIGENGNDPIYIFLKQEGIRLRFDQFYQRLELIEIEVKAINRKLTVNYKNTPLLQPNRENGITYSSIVSLFGPSSIPRLIDNNKFLLLRYNGISFLFECEEDTINSSFSEDLNLSLFSDLLLTKISIFSENFLINSISRENSLFKMPLPIVKFDLDKGMYFLLEPTQDENLITSKGNEECFIPFNESLENILFSLKNPNYIFYKDNGQEQEYEWDNSYTEVTKNEDTDFFLNYYSYGLDILIDAKTHKAKKFIFHTNNPYDSKFGIYSKCNFTIEFTKNFMKKLEFINEANTMNDRESMNININTNVNTNTNINISSQGVNYLNPNASYLTPCKSRKQSEDSRIISDEKEETNFLTNSSGTDKYDSNQINLVNPPSHLKIEKTSNMIIESKSSNEKDKEYYSSCGLGYRENYNASTFKEETPTGGVSNCYNVYKKRRNENKTSIESRDYLQGTNEKSFCSMNESNLSISLNTSDIFVTLSVTANTNFNEIVNRVPPNSYVIFHRHESKLNAMSKFYSFDGVIFEVLENQNICSVTLFEPIVKI